jgi:ABC-type transporter Mla MlaB component
MPLQTAYIAEERRLDLIVDGNLDLTLTQDICNLCRRASSELVTCIVDLSGVDRVFDSGVALLHMLYRRLEKLGTVVVILSDHPRVCKHIPACRGSVHRRAAAPPS